MTSWECHRCGAVNAPTAAQCTCKPESKKSKSDLERLVSETLPPKTPKTSPVDVGPYWPPFAPPPWCSRPTGNTASLCGAV